MLTFYLSGLDLNQYFEIYAKRFSRSPSALRNVKNLQFDSFMHFPASPVVDIWSNYVAMIPILSFDTQIS